MMNYFENRISNFYESFMNENVTKTSAFIFTPNINNSNNINTSELQEELNDPYFIFVQKRVKYLDSLHNLSDDWISGESKKPDSSAINTCKQILYSFIPSITLKSLPNPLCENQKNTYIIKKHEFQKILMGPIPSGGIGIEFHLNNKNAMFVTIPNGRKKIEIDIKKDDYYYELKNTKKLIAGTVINVYRNITEY